MRITTTILCFLLCSLSIWAQKAKVPSSEALSKYENMVKAEPTNGLAWARLGQAHLAQNQYEQALLAFQKCLTLNFFPGQTHFHLAKTYAALKNNAKAINHLDQAVNAGFGNLKAITDEPLFQNLLGNPDFKALLDKIKKAANPCDFDPIYRQFDFWVGQWEVHTKDGQFAGSNTISKAEGNCLIYEEWKGARGTTGRSLNYYDARKQKWVQNWISNGLIIDIAGNLEGKSMILVGEIHTYSTQKTDPFRGTWTPLEDGRVRQFFEISSDGGKTWAPWFEGFYTRKTSQ